MSTTKRVDRYVNDKELIDMSTTKLIDMSTTKS